jgi:hypothetical protein
MKNENTSEGEEFCEYSPYLKEDKENIFMENG